MSWHHETNPHFGRPPHEDERSLLPTSGAATPQPHRHDQQNQPPVPWSTRPQTQDPYSQPPQPRPQPQPSLSPWFRQPQLQPHGQDRPGRQPSSTAPRAKKPKHNQPLGPWSTLPDNQDQRVRPSQLQGEHSGPQVSGPWKQQPHQPQPQDSQVTQPKQHPQPHSPQHQDHQPRRRPSQGPRVPLPPRTKLTTWFLAGFCAIFWVVIILGGLIVLIIYLLFRPHNPRFDVSSVTLNAAYLDVGALLNADLTVLANFTNPNKKVKVDFSYVVLDLYYGRTLIASQYVEPFTAARATSWLTNVHMVTSQVRLPLEETERLEKERASNAVVFQVKGVFRARSNLGSFLRYSYWLYSHCTIMMTGPPSGVLRGGKCKTKR
ncbi:Late embryogenesis abundant protein [Melia azedarach]|uniref:Late embryogenesis abundant protein n=1 Tax=Melia azedarach TaxID=155640 RepID=A0ACC1XJX6_MELAZ|nr:Late embryogenesis abundant protein [Melia azedarach]